MINESKSPFIDALVAKFGKHMVYFDNDNTYKINLSDLQFIQKCANEYIFNNKLKLRPIELLDHVYVANVGDALGRYNYHDNEKHDDQHYIIDLVFDHDYLTTIQLNKTKLSKDVNLMFIVNILVHEMIHQYDIECADYLHNKFMCHINRVKHIVHGNTFAKMMNEINTQHGLNINPVGFSIEHECEQSLQNLQQFDGVSVITKIKEDEYHELIKTIPDSMFEQTIRHEDGSYSCYVV